MNSDDILISNEGIVHSFVHANELQYYAFLCSRAQVGLIHSVWWFELNLSGSCSYFITNMWISSTPSSSTLTDREAIQFFARHPKTERNIHKHWRLRRGKCITLKIKAGEISCGCESRRASKQKNRSRFFTSSIWTAREYLRIGQLYHFNVKRL